MTEKEKKEIFGNIVPNFNTNLANGTITMNLDYYNCLEEYIRRILDELDKKDEELVEERIKYISSNLNNTIKQKQKEDEQLNALNEGWKIELENKDKEIQELKEKWDKDTHTLQNQLDLANADRVEKDKMIDLFKCRIVVTENEHKEILKIQEKFLEKDFQDCLIIYFQKKAREENE